MQKPNLSIHHKINERAIKKFFQAQELAETLFDDSYGAFNETPMDLEDYEKAWEQTIEKVFGYHRTASNMMDWMVKRPDFPIQEDEMGFYGTGFYSPASRAQFSDLGIYSPDSPEAVSSMSSYGNIGID